MNIDDLTVKEVKKSFSKLGYKITYFGKKNANGPDIFVVKNGIPKSVELKKSRTTKRNSIQIPPVEKARKNDDLVCIILGDNYVLIEPMRDHLSKCTAKGYRTINL